MPYGAVVVGVVLGVEVLVLVGEDVGEVVREVLGVVVRLDVAVVVRVVVTEVLGVVEGVVVGDVLGEVVGEVATQSCAVIRPKMGWSNLRLATPPRQSVRRMHTAVCAAARWPSKPMGSASYANAWFLSQARHWPAPASQVNGHSAQPDAHAHAAPVLVTPSKQATLVGVVV